VSAVALSADGRTLATSSDDTVMLWDLSDRTTPRQLGRLTGHDGPVSAVALSADGRTLATRGGATVMLWDLSDRNAPRQVGQSLRHSEPVWSVALSTDGRTLGIGSGWDSVILWDFTDLNDLRDHPTERACAITGRGFEPDEWARYIPGLPYEHTCQ
jgi:WD40 repeat protein